MKWRCRIRPTFKLAVAAVFCLWLVPIQAKPPEKGADKPSKEQKKEDQTKRLEELMNFDVDESLKHPLEGERTKAKKPPKGPFDFDINFGEKRAEDDHRWWKDLPWSQAQLDKNKQFVLNNPEYFTRGDPNGNINDHLAILDKNSDRFGRIDLEQQVADNLDFIRKSGWMKDKVYCEALGKHVSIMNPYVNYARLNIPAVVNHISGLSVGGATGRPGRTLGCNSGSTYLIEHASNGTAQFGAYMHQQEIPPGMAYTTENQESAMQRSGVMHHFDTIDGKNYMPPMDLSVRVTPQHWVGHFQGWSVANGQEAPISAGGRLTSSWGDKEWNTEVSTGPNAKTYYMISERPQTTPTEYAANLRNMGLTPLENPAIASDPIPYWRHIPMPSSGKWDNPYPYSPIVNSTASNSSSPNGGRNLLSQSSSSNNNLASSSNSNQPASAADDNRSSGNNNSALQQALLLQQMQVNEEMNEMISLLGERLREIEKN